MFIARGVTVSIVSGLVALTMTACINLPPNPSSPMGLRERNGVIELYICESIDLTEVGLEYRTNRNSGDLVELYRGPAQRELSGGDVVSLGSLLPGELQGITFESLDLSDLSRFGVSLVDSADQSRNQVSVFLFTVGLPEGDLWLSPTGAYSADPCAQ